VDPIRTHAGALAQAVLAPAKAGDIGFLLVDPAINLIYANDEAVQIVCYPAKDGKRFYGGVFQKTLRTILLSQGVSRQVSFVTEFSSGRRHYYCRALSVHLRSDPSNREDVALLLERAPAVDFVVRIVCEKYHLTEREREVVTYLARGLAGKEIAVQMEISPNTVKAFLRLAMIKMGVSGRLAIMAKIMGCGN